MSRPWWLELLLDVLGGGPAAAPAAVGGSITVPILDTGYSVEADVAARLAVLEQAQLDAMSLYPASGETTFCNEGLQHVAGALDCHDFVGLNANQIVAKATASPDWTEDSWERAAEHALKGGLAFLGWVNPRGHGHVVSVMARPLQLSPSWGVPVPVLASVGEPPNEPRLASACFLHAEQYEIRCFLWKVE